MLLGLLPVRLLTNHNAPTDSNLLRTEFMEGYLVISTPRGELSISHAEKANASMLVQTLSLGGRYLSHLPL